MVRSTRQQIKGIERTHRAAKHLLELVNDVLDLSKIEAGKIELQLEPVAFPALIEDLFVTVRPMADEHGSKLSLQHEGEPVTVVSTRAGSARFCSTCFPTPSNSGAANPFA